MGPMARRPPRLLLPPQLLLLLLLPSPLHPVSFEAPTLVGSNRDLPYFNATAFPHFFFPISVRTGHGNSVAQHVTLADDGPVCPAPGQPGTKCSETLITRDGGRSYVLATSNGHDTSDNFTVWATSGSAFLRAVARMERTAALRRSQATTVGTGWTRSRRWRSCSTGRTPARLSR
jgi:hypothetical protein